MGNDNQVRTEFVTGPAGSGKSFRFKSMIEEDPGCAILCATTGVAAVNLDTVTVHSVLGFSNTDTLIDKYVRGYIHQKLRALAQTNRPRSIVIDEVSMLHAEQLDTIYNAISEVNQGDDRHEPLKYPLGLTLTGDFCQLPPVPDKKMVGGKLVNVKPRFAFEADCWPEFAANITRLTKIWRQSDPCFLLAVNAARRGEGEVAASQLRSLNAQFSLAVDLNFDGTTIVAKNAEADRFNSQRLLKLTTPSFALEARRWGQQSPDWKNIPDRTILKPGALVMLLANKKYGGAATPFQYVNGDLAHVIEYNPCAQLTDWQGEYEAAAVLVTSVRTGETFWVESIVRENVTKDEPEQGTLATYDEERKHWIIGTVEWFPMRLGYCATVHKSQGLSLDRIQIDCRDGFFGAPSMAYVALSRARTVSGMRIVGGPELLSRRIKFNPAVRDWL